MKLLNFMSMIILSTGYCNAAGIYLSALESPILIANDEIKVIK